MVIRPNGSDSVSYHTSDSQNRTTTKRESDLLIKSYSQGTKNPHNDQKIAPYYVS